eukprot:g17358.t1
MLHSRTVSMDSDSDAILSSDAVQSWNVRSKLRYITINRLTEVLRPEDEAIIHFEFVTVNPADQLVIYAMSPEGFDFTTVFLESPADGTDSGNKPPNVGRRLLWKGFTGGIVLGGIRIPWIGGQALFTMHTSVRGFRQDEIEMCCYEGQPVENPAVVFKVPFRLQGLRAVLQSEWDQEAFNFPIASSMKTRLDEQHLVTFTFQLAAPIELAPPARRLVFVVRAPVGYFILLSDDLMDVRDSSIPYASSVQDATVQNGEGLRMRSLPFNLDFEESTGGMIQLVLPGLQKMPTEREYRILFEAFTPRRHALRVPNDLWVVEITDDYKLAQVQVVNEEAPDAAQLQLNDAGLRYLESQRSPLFLIPALGVYRGGKSLLLNRLMQRQAPYAQSFGIGHGQETFTRGIEICAEALPNHGGTVVWMDTEGLFSSEDARSAYGPKIFSLALLFSSVVLLNNLKVLNQQFFVFFEEQQQVARILREGLRSEGMRSDLLLPENLPIVWVLQQPINFAASAEASRHQLDSFLTIQDKARERIKDSFKHLIHEVPTATHDARQWSKLDQVSDNQLLLEYVSATKDLRYILLTQLQTARPLQAPSVAAQLRMYVDLVQKDHFSISLAKEAFEDSHVAQLCESFGQNAQDLASGLPAVNLSLAMNMSEQLIQEQRDMIIRDFHLGDAFLRRLQQCLDRKRLELEDMNGELVLEEWQKDVHKHPGLLEWVMRYPQIPWDLLSQICGILGWIRVAWILGSQMFRPVETRTIGQLSNLELKVNTLLERTEADVKEKIVTSALEAALSIDSNDPAAAALSLVKGLMVVSQVGSSDTHFAYLFEAEHRSLARATVKSFHFPDKDSQSRCAASCKKDSSKLLRLAISNEWDELIPAMVVTLEKLSGRKDVKDGVTSSKPSRRLFQDVEDDEVEEAQEQSCCGCFCRFCIVLLLVSEQKGSLDDFELLSKVNFTATTAHAPPEVVITLEVILYDLGEESEYPNRVDVYAPSGYKFLLSCFAPGERERLKNNLVSCRERWTLFNGNYLSGAILMAADNGVLPRDMPLTIKLLCSTPPLTPERSDG